MNQAAILFADRMYPLYKQSHGDDEPYISTRPTTCCQDCDKSRKVDSFSSLLTAPNTKAMELPPSATKPCLRYSSCRDTRAKHVTFTRNDKGENDGHVHVEVHTIPNLKLDLTDEEQRQVWYGKAELVAFIEQHFEQVLNEEEQRKKQSVKGPWDEFVRNLTSALAFLFLYQDPTLQECVTQGNVAPYTGW
mmetsp:Transcript_11142/g.17900  ORF Transcript_11142/g.17900 Transcript_11142/m.17900 type:complete len:191 (+) Transcript_11142:221-793(+)